jgi:hypothetical protein
MGCKPTKTITYFDSDGVGEEGKEAQEIEPQEIEKVR